MKGVLFNRINREKATIRAMVMIYCANNHGRKHILCAECSELNEYARHRLDKCPFGDTKPTCVNCLVHCYQPAMREKVKVVMRYAGPRMLTRHPILAIFHLIDGRIYKPKAKAEKKQNLVLLQQHPKSGRRMSV